MSEAPELYAVYWYRPTSMDVKTFETREEAAQFYSRCAEWPDTLDVRLVDYRGMDEELVRLQEWKRDATTLLNAVDAVHDMLPSSYQKLGQSKIYAIQQFVRDHR